MIARLGATLAIVWFALPAWADLGAAMESVRARDWDAAMAELRGHPPEIRALVTWHRLRAGAGGFAEYQAFLRDHSDFPGLPLLRQRGEVAIPASIPAAEVLAYFDGASPQTADGVLRLTQALAQAGRSAAAQAEAVRAWREMDLGAQAESVLLARYGEVLADHHVARMDALLWAGAREAAARQRPRVPEGWRLLHDARAALRADEPGVDARIAAVPATLADDPGLAWERAEWRARRGRDADVVVLMLERSVTAAALGRPEAWAPRRRVLVRQLMRAGDVREAYLLASQHHLTTGTDFADLEWLSGYLALRRLDSPAAALAHFRAFRAGVSGPISLGRAGYWEGRAHEVLGQTVQAATAYAFGAEFQTTFYGQLAAERAGLPMDPALTGAEVFPVARDSPIAAAGVFRAGMALHAAGDPVLAARFFAHQAESLDRGGIGRLLSLTEALGDPYVQLQIAKRAASMGIVLERAYFPLMRIDTQGLPDVSPELALAIARRESEFNAGVVSPAGARGLMQVMPGTAQDTAAALGLPFDPGRLTSDPDYNARLGTAYLQGLRDRFGGATILVVAGYNAGPARPPQWIAANGDPRGGAVDPVDWIEAIPFTETRNYVMRVMEALAPYRARLSGQVGPLTLSRELAAR